ncbi:MAG: signal peptidase II [Gemmatimonadota bacterium]
MKKAHLFWPLVSAIVLADCTSKRAIEGSLQPGQPVEILGEFVRFTLGYNTGIAFGIPFGVGARPLLILFTLIACAGIVWIYRTTDARQRLQIVALGFIMGGAIGNLLDRFRSSSGVVDFIDVGVGATRFWTFNVADSAITVGAVLLVLTSLFEPSERKPETT